TLSVAGALLAAAVGAGAWWAASGDDPAAPQDTRHSAPQSP
ncbi:serine/threonine protein kinase, partial [Streptomyces sp. SID9944]|nr:serine/threonine protein kinase [Streptomyces sp. SID9944]